MNKNDSEHHFEWKNLRSAWRDLLTDFKVGSLQCWAGEQPGENHVDGNREAVADVTFSYLDVLDLCGISGITLSTTWTQQTFRKTATQTRFIQSSLHSAYSPQVSTRTSCSSILFIGTSEFSTTTSPVSGWLMMQLVASKWPLIRNFGSEVFWR